MIYTDSFNVFKNTNVKNLLLYSRSLNILTQFDNSTEIENIILNCLQEHKAIKSQYNLFLKDPKFFSILNDTNLIPERQEKSLLENLKLNSEIKSLEEKLHFTQMLNQKDEFIFFVRKFLDTLIKHGLFYKLIDFFTFFFKFNQKKLFAFLEEKKDQLLEDLIKENIEEIESIPSDVKDFIKKVVM